LGARGDVWTLPVESGITRNLTKSDGVHDRNVAWSPDGEYIAYISDRTGNDELYIQKQDGKEEAIQLTDPKSVSETYKYQPSWSPDSKKITWYDKMNRLMMIDVASKKVTEVAKSQDGEMRDFAWSPDSKWIAYSDNNMSEFSRIFIYNVDTQKAEPVTDTWFNSSNPTFDKNGKYLYFTSERDFNPTYSSVEWNYAYREMSRIYMITLQKDTPSPFLTKNDEVTVDKGEAKEEKSGKSDKGKDKKKDSKKEDDKTIKIDFEGIMSRVIPLPDLNTAYYYDLNAVENGLYYMSWGNRGGGLYYYDLEEKKLQNR